MATKKITLNELRTLIKQVIKENELRTLIKQIIKEEIEDGHGKTKVTKQMWIKMSDEKKFDALLSVIEDPDDAEKYIDSKWEDLPSGAERDMILFDDIDDIDDAVDDALELLDPSELKGIDLSEAIITEKKELLNEAVTTLVIGGLLAAPKLIEWLGKAIKFIGKKLLGKDETKIADWIIKKGRKWEKLYIKAIIAAVKFTGFAKQIWKREDGSIDKQKLVLTAKVLFAVILAVAGGIAVKGVLSAHSPIIEALESTFAGVKAAEIVGIIGKVKSQI